MRMNQRRCRYHPASLGLRAASFLTMTIASLPLEKSWQKGKQSECKGITMMFDANKDVVVLLQSRIALIVKIWILTMKS